MNALPASVPTWNGDSSPARFEAAAREGRILGGISSDGFGHITFYERPTREESLREIERLQTVHRLAKYPSAQAEALARHYLSMAQIAKDLKWLVDQERYAPEVMVAGGEECILMLTNQIKEAHLKDLGIELKWETGERTYV